MPIDLLALAAELIAGEGLEFAKNKAKREEGVLRVLSKLGFSLDAPPANDFNGVYAYTLVVYGVDKPKPVLEFFRHEFIKSAFRKSFERRDSSILEKETENFLDWNEIGRDIRAIDYDPRREFAEFREQFIIAAKLTRTVQEILVDHKLVDIQGSIDKVPNIEDFRKELQPIVEGIEKIYGGGDKIVIAPNIERVQIGLGIKEYPRPKEYVLFRASNFVGRQIELEEVSNLLHQEGSIGLYALKGMGGIGKSALAAEVAAFLDNENRFPGGILWANLAMESTSEIARRWLGNYGFDVSHEEEQTRLIRLGTVLAQIPALLILDNAQNESSVRKLIVKAKGVAVLVTTRKQSAIPIGVRPIALDQMPPDEALSLLEKLGGEKVRTDPDTAKGICMLCGYLPLALSLAGSQLGNNGRWKTLINYKTQLEQRRLQTLSGGDEQENNVRLALDISYQELSDLQKDIFKSLGLFIGSSFSPTAITKLIGLEESAEDMLEQLVDLSLVMRAGDGRYRLHDLVKDYAVEVLSSTQKDKAISWKKSLIIFYQNFSTANSSQYQALDIERQNIIGVVEFTNEDNDRDWSLALIDIARQMTDYFKVRGLWKEASRIGEIAFNLALSLGLVDDQAFLATWTLSWVYFHQGNIPLAKEFARKGLVLYGQTGSDKDKAAAARRLGMAMISSGQYEEAHAYLLDALEIFRKIQLPSKVGDTLTVIGYLERKRGNFSLAQSHLDEAFRIVSEIKDQKEISMVLYQLGRLAATSGNMVNAKRFHAESLAIDKQLLRKPGITWNYFRLGQLERLLNNKKEAEENLKLAMRMFDEMGVPERVHQIYQDLVELNSSVE